MSKVGYALCTVNVFACWLYQGPNQAENDGVHGVVGLEELNHMYPISSQTTALLVAYR